MKKSWILPSALAALLLVAPACNRRPKGVLSDDKMVNLMVDLKLAETYAQQHRGDPADSLSTKLAASVLESHGVSRADFDSTIAWYGRHFDEYVSLSDQMEKRLLKRQKDFLAEDVVSLSEDDNLWPYAQRIIVSPAGSTDGFSFSVDAGDLKPGETLKWKMKLMNSASGKLLLGVEYSDGSADYISRQGGSSDVMEFSLSLDSVLKPKRVFGVYHIPHHYLPVTIDSISLMRQPIGNEDAQGSLTPFRYVRPEKYDPVKARIKMQADSIALAKKDSADKAEAAEADGLLRVSRNVNRSAPARPGQ